MSEHRKIAILGGTRDARTLAYKLYEAGHDVITSLAGRTTTPEEISGRVRIGHFGGEEGLADWLKEEGIDCMIDATHPFSAKMTSNAHWAGKSVDCPVIHLQRKSWQQQDGDNWVRVSSYEEAAHAIPVNSRVFLSVGRQPISHFAHRRDIYAIMRMIDAPSAECPLPAGDVLLARPGKTASQEEELFRQYGITCLVSKFSGGASAYPKIEAARHLKIPVIIIERPQADIGETADSLEAVIKWVGDL